MADIELVIKIPEEDYKKIIEYGECDYLRIINAIENGTLFPKGHGRLGDLDKLIRAMKERNNDNGGEPLNAVDRGYDLAFQHIIEESKECVILKADKVESEDKG